MVKCKVRTDQIWFIFEGGHCARCSMWQTEEKVTLRYLKAHWPECRCGTERPHPEISEY